MVETVKSQYEQARHNFVRAAGWRAHYNEVANTVLG
jgi:hypothetical protein